MAWITKNSKGDAAAYIKSTKIPALSDILDIDLSNMSLPEVADIVSSQVGDSSLSSLVRDHTGFTNFYMAYRNSALDWIEANINVLLPLYRSAYAPQGDAERLRIVESITELDGIPKANQPQQLMRPEYFLTPAFFTLDPEIRFPLINGNKGVQYLLRKLGVLDSGLVAQYRAMTSLYGTGGIRDAADLDQANIDLPDFVTTDTQPSTKKLLEEKNTTADSDLPLKDEKDIESIIKAGTAVQRQIHNKLTNKLRDSLTKFTLIEGKNENCMFDTLVKRYDNSKNDLLIEVKSSTDSPNVRMAVGQLFHYWHVLKGDKKHHLAILLPERPTKEIEAFLNWMTVGLLWFENDQLCTKDDWLQCIAHKS